MKAIFEKIFGMKNLNFLITGICLFLGTIFFSCSKEKIKGSGTVISETRSVENFYSISASAASLVSISYGNAYSVSVKGFENIIPNLQTFVENGTLIIKYASNTTVSNDNSEVDIMMPSLVSVNSVAKNNISVSGNFIGMNSLTATTSGGGNISFANAKTTDLALNISGSGNISSFGLNSQNAIVKINGSGNAEVAAAQKLSVNINGSGNVYYKGSPAIDSTISGTGRVIKQ